DEDLLAFYRALIALRRARPELSDGDRSAVRVAFDEDARWLVVTRRGVAVACNLAAGRQEVPVPGRVGRVLLASTDGWVFGEGRVETDGESVVVLELVDPLPQG
ncbi:MAG: DUF3459 domain-containing protein, partial [Nocardioidaceae bacterium]